MFGYSKKSNNEICSRLFMSLFHEVCFISFFIRDNCECASKRRPWLGPNLLAEGSVPSLRDGVGLAVVTVPTESIFDEKMSSATGLRIYVFGGIGPGSTVGMNDMHRYDIDSMSWKSIGSLAQNVGPSPRYNLQMVALGQTLYIFGGFGPNGNFLNDLYSFDTVGLKWTQVNASNPPTPRNNFPAAALDGYMCVFGGRAAISPISSTRGRLNDLQCFDPTSLRWILHNSSKESPTHRSASSMVAVREGLLLYGGFSDNGALGDLNRWDKITGQWTLLNTFGAIPVARYGHNAAILDGFLYIFGGQNSGNVFLSELFRLGLSTLTWTLVDQSGNQPSLRSYFGLAATHTGFYMYGGFFSGSSGNVFLGDFFRCRLNNTSNSSVEQNKPVSVAWADLTGPLKGIFPSARLGHGFFAEEEIEHFVGSNRVVYLFGGFQPPGALMNTGVYFNDLYELDIQSLAWKSLANSSLSPLGANRKPSPRAFMGVASSQGKIFVFGGSSNASGDPLGDFFAFDVISGNWLQLWPPEPTFDSIEPTFEPSMLPPTARSNHGMTTAGGVLYVFGGSGVGGALLNDLHRYDPVTRFWIRLDALGAPSSRIDFGFAGSWATGIFVFGGCDAQGELLNDLHQYSPSSSQWHMIFENSKSNSQGPSPRSSLSLAVTGGRLFVFGGSTIGGPCVIPNEFYVIYQSDLFMFDPIGGRWMDVSSMIEGVGPSGRCGTSLAAASGRLIIFGGCSNLLQNDIWGFHPPSTVLWPSPQAASAGRRPEEDFFLDLYDWDTLLIQTFIKSDNEPAAALSLNAELCSGPFPCVLNLLGGESSSAKNEGNGRARLLRTVDGGISCNAQLGCGRVQVSNIEIICLSTSIDMSLSKFPVLNVLGAARFQIENTSFVGCASSQDGGVIRASSSATLMLTGVDFLQARTSGSGGAIAIDSCDLFVNNCRFVNCMAKFRTNTAGSGGGFGGAINSVQSNLYVAWSFFEACESQRGGGAISCGGGTAELNSTVFTNCSSYGDGGAVMSYGGSELKIMHSAFARGWSDGQGGCIISAGGSTIAAKSRFVDCWARTGGGAIFTGAFQCYGYYRGLLQTGLTLVECEFDGCSSEGSGGAVLAKSSDVYCSISGSFFRNCLAGTSGGALAISDTSTMTLKNSIFALNRAGTLGGAAFIETQAAANILNSSFIFNVAQIAGGAVAADGASALVANLSDFHNNSALGRGGGAIYTRGDSPAHFGGLNGTGNTADAGGGGFLFWEGIGRPFLAVDGTEQVDDIFLLEASRCGRKNRAVYGPCVASSFMTLQVVSLATLAAPAHPGLPTTLSVLKKDAYMQTITTDTTSVLLAQSALNGDVSRIDQAMSMSGQAVMQLFKGAADFSLILKPSFSSVTWSPGLGSDGLLDGQAVLSSQPYIYFYGTDLETLLPLKSAAVQVVMANGPTVCPRGFVLVLDSLDSVTTTRDSFFPDPPKKRLIDEAWRLLLQSTTLSRGRGGACTECPRGTYSVHPLAGVTANQPSCLNCPAGGVCQGGDRVNFPVGLWRIVNGVYHLQACPDGHQLVNSIGGIFAHDLQQCLACGPSQYVVDSSNPNFNCQECPAGALCNGSVLISLVLGSVWRADDSGRYVLTACPAGYYLASVAMLCLVCPAGSYCVGGDSESSTPCPANTFAPAGSSAQAACETSVLLLVTITLPLSRQQFASTTAQFIAALSAAGGIPTSRVYIQSSIRRASTSQAASNVSSVLGEDALSVRIVAHLAAVNMDQAQSIQRLLNADNLNHELMKRGLLSGIINSVVVSTSVGTGDTNVTSNTTLVILAAFGAALGFALLVALVSRRTLRRLWRRADHRSFLETIAAAKPGDTAVSAKFLPWQLRDQYLAECVLGKGSFGCVVQVIARRGDRKAAIKFVVPEKAVFEPRESRTIQREAAALELMTHRHCPHAVNLAGDVYIGPDLCWFVMELLDGMDVDSVIADPKQGPISDTECIRLARGVLAALKVLHGEGLLHRDIKPANVMRCLVEGGRRDSGGETVHEITKTEPGQSAAGNHEGFEWVSHQNGSLSSKLKESHGKQSVANSRGMSKTNTMFSEYSYKLVDFGNVLGIDEKVARENMMTVTGRGIGAGTPPYMSPEMLRDPESTSYPTDLWSLGVSLFESVTGTLPFQAESDFLWAVVIAGDMDKEAPSVLDRLEEARRSSFDHHLARAISKAMQKRVQDRYASVDEMHEAIYACLIRRGEAVYSVFISYRVATEAPLARLLFDDLNHTVTPMGHRVTVFWDAHRLVQGEAWEEGFATGLSHSLCVFPILSYGSTAPLATLPPDRVAAGWEAEPAGRRRLEGTEADAEDNFLKEVLIAEALLEARDRGDEDSMVQVILPVLAGRQHPRGHPDYPRMGSFFDVQGGGGVYPKRPSPATSRAAASFLRDRVGLAEEVVQAVERRSVAEAMAMLMALQGCKLWLDAGPLGEAALSREQGGLAGAGLAGPSGNLGGAALPEGQGGGGGGGGLDLPQLRMLKAQVQSRRRDLHEVIDRAVAARARAALRSRSPGSLHLSLPPPPQRLPDSREAEPGRSPAPSRPAGPGRRGGEAGGGRGRGKSVRARFDAEVGYLATG